MYMYVKFVLHSVDIQEDESNDILVVGEDKENLGTQNATARTTTTTNNACVIAGEL